MSSSVANGRVTGPDKLDVIPRPKPAKATLPDKVSVEQLSGVVIDAAKTVYGKQGAAAAQLGKDEGNFSRDVKAGRFALPQMAELGPDWLVAFASSVLDEFAPLATPAARARHLLREQRRITDELEQLTEFMGERTA
jgi:hypothetical protein